MYESTRVVTKPYILFKKTYVHSDWPLERFPGETNAGLFRG
jgi:hypothetical protein